MRPPYAPPQSAAPFAPDDGGATASSTAAAAGICVGTARPWPFFPAPEVETENGLVAPLRENGHVVKDATGKQTPHIVRFRNESYAPEEALGDARLKRALLAARKRGIEVIALFPDAPDHIHVDVKSEP